MFWNLFISVLLQYGQDRPLEPGRLAPDLAGSFPQTRPADFVSIEMNEINGMALGTGRFFGQEFVCLLFQLKQRAGLPARRQQEFRF